MNSFLHKDFIFSPRYRIWRHIAYWSFHITLWATFWTVIGIPLSFGRHLLNMLMWTPAFILFSYPLVYGAIPHLLLKGKVVQFALVILIWGVFGMWLDISYRTNVLIPAQEWMGLRDILPRGPLAFCFLCMTTSAASPMIIKFFKLWNINEQKCMNAQEQKITAELQLLKSQLYPHFLFNTLNNIYSFALENSAKTPGMIQNLSSLINYMLYDCKADEVLLEKELEVMKNYVDLEKERYGNKLELSWIEEGEVENKWIAPLMMLPFLENAFKHGASQLIEGCWIEVFISVNQNKLHFEIRNLKNDIQTNSVHGIGIENVIKRLDFIYPGKHDLRLTEGKNIYEVSLCIELRQEPDEKEISKVIYIGVPQKEAVS